MENQKTDISDENTISIGNTSVASSSISESEMKNLILRPIIVFGSCLLAVVLTVVSFFLSNKTVNIGSIGDTNAIDGQDVTILIVSLVVSFILFGFSMRMFIRIRPVVVLHVIIMAVFCLALSSVFS